MDFIKHLPQKVNEESILVSFDVTNLCTNISDGLGIRYFARQEQFITSPTFLQILQYQLRTKFENK